MRKVPEVADASDDARTSRFVSVLADNPLAVVGTTLAIGAAATALLVVAVDGMDVATVVGTLATLWGLDLAVVIYLLTARDTDRLLTRIDALQDQLSAALESPGLDADVVEVEPTPAQTTTVSPASPVSEQPVPEQLASSAPPPPSQLVDRVPADYLAAFLSRSGVSPSDIRLAWTPHPEGGGPWVLEDGGGARWSVFRSGGGRPTVIPLDARRRHRDQQREHDERRRRRGQLRARDERRRPGAPGDPASPQTQHQADHDQVPPVDRR